MESNKKEQYEQYQFIPDSCQTNLPDQFKQFENFANKVLGKLRNDEEEFQALLLMIESLPTVVQLQIETLTLPQKRKLYVILDLSTHYYICQGGLITEKQKRLTVLPKQIANPFQIVCDLLGIEPVLTYASVCLWNWRQKDPTQSATDFKNLTTIYSITGNDSEKNFYLVHTAIELAGKNLVKDFFNLNTENQDKLEQYLSDCNESLDLILKQALYMKRDYVNPEFFFRTLRIFLAGYQKEDGYPGLTFQTEKESYISNAVGGSGAQSSLFQFFDIIFGIPQDDQKQFQCPFSFKQQDYTLNTSAQYLHEVRKNMPSPHQQILDNLDQSERTQQFQQATQQNQVQQLILQKILLYRRMHMDMVNQYILTQIPDEIKFNALSKTCQQGLSIEEYNSKKSLYNREFDENFITGTGGTPAVQFLNHQISITEAQLKQKV